MTVAPGGVRYLCLNLVFFQLAIERSLADTKQPCRQKFVTIELRNRVEDGLPFQLRDGNDFVRTIPLNGVMAVFASYSTGQICNLDFWTAVHGASSLQTVFQFPHIAGPISGKQGLDGRR